jgi:hypothetical protein
MGILLGTAQIREAFSMQKCTADAQLVTPTGVDTQTSVLMLYAQPRRAEGRHFTLVTIALMY